MCFDPLFPSVVTWGARTTRTVKHEVVLDRGTGRVVRGQYAHGEDYEYAGIGTVSVPETRKASSGEGIAGCGGLLYEKS